MNENMNIVNILHISDLHFGIENKNGIELPIDFKLRREFVLEALIDKLKVYSATTEIDVVIISGDVGFLCTEQEYEEFEKWIGDLLNAINVEPSNVIICPGNHDFDRSCKVEKITSENFLSLLSVDKISERISPFNHFQNMCQRLGVPILTNSAKVINDNRIDYLYGIYYLEKYNILFTILNSSWNEGEKVDNQSRWLGISLVRDVDLLIKKIKRDNDNLIVISVFHHPLTSMNSADSYEKYDHKETSYQHLANFTSLIFNGHTHGGVQEPTSINNDIKVFRSGAVHSTDTELFEFEIISINTLLWSYKQFVGKYEDSKWKIDEYNGVEGAIDKYFSYGQKATDLLMNQFLGKGDISKFMKKMSPVVRNIFDILNKEINNQESQKKYNTEEDKELDNTIINHEKEMYDNLKTKCKTDQMLKK